ncbi:uncharacterized protein LOC129595769 [Paramacrobiotus metropolitanus]|uniref:uncharacterized protein LOC129595769 n=1 Tax=Paramacrobiotus metropolitanus TaxID=2943436 RepID=UPI002445784A|nr:uncharacterized protein LOC129595769 [Paramacrobiotus metropolitanus]
MDRANGIPLRTAIVPTRRTRRTRLVAHPHQNASYHDSVAPGTFIMLSVDLGQGFCSMSLEDSKALIEQLNGSLLHPYCGQFSVVSLVDAKLEGGCKMVTQAHDLPGFADYLRVQVFRRIKYLLDHAPAAVDVTVKGLPVELMQEIFSHLDTVKQKQLQRVCALWNRILVAPALRGTIVIRSNGLTTSVLGFMTVIRCLHPSTQRLILTSFEHGQCSTNYVMMFLGKVFFPRCYG